MDLLTRIRNLLAPMDLISTGWEPSLSPLTEIRAVIFDLYGTLFMSGSGDIGVAAATNNRDALRQALIAVGLSEDAAQVDDWTEAIRASHVTARAQGVAHPEIEVRTVWRRVVRGPVSAEQIEALAVEYECRVNPVWPMPKLEETLAALRERNVFLGIVSNAQFFTPLLFEACLGRTPDSLAFAPSLCAWSYQWLEAKPSPNLFAPVIGGLDALGLQPHQALYVGNDMLNDIRTASRTGFRTCLFAGDLRSLRLRAEDPHCQALQPDRIITALDQIPALLREE